MNLGRHSGYLLGFSPSSHPMTALPEITVRMVPMLDASTLQKRNHFSSTKKKKDFLLFSSNYKKACFVSLFKMQMPQRKISCLLRCWFIYLHPISFHKHLKLIK